MRFGIWKKPDLSESLFESTKKLAETERETCGVSLPGHAVGKLSTVTAAYIRRARS
jgi:hypothetical protein